MKLKANKFSLKNSWKSIVAVLMLLLVFVFFRNERTELSNIIPDLEKSDWRWVVVGILVSCIYISLQSAMYIGSFRAVGLRLTFRDALELFLKRNFLSVFLPVGGVSALAYLPDTLKKRNINVKQAYQASAINGYIALFTVLLVGIPVVFYTLFTNKLFGNSWIWLIVLASLLGALFWIASSFNKKGILHRFIEKKRPDFAEQIHQLFSGDINKKPLLWTLIFSTFVEISCIAIVYVAMRAVNVQHSLEVASIGYIISVIFMTVSPFLRGLGAVEFSLLVIFQKYGYSNEQSLSITMLYRIFEFWMPLALGVVAFVWRGRQILVRVIPAIFIFSLGIVNIVSSASPPLAERWHQLLFYIPTEVAHISNLMILALGIALIFTSVYLLKGYRTAWILGLVFSVLSIVGHLGKGLDYEEATFGFISVIMLILSRNQYNIKSSQKWMQFGFQTFLMAFGAVFIFDFLAFYIINKHHFGIDFTWRQSLEQTYRSFVFLADAQIVPKTKFATELLYVTRFLGFTTWLLLLYTLLQPKIFKGNNTAKSRETAELLLRKYGNSSNDFFKIQADKQLYFSSGNDAFTAFRTANHFAVVLEEPVCSDDDRLSAITEFENYCKEQNLNPIYYRVSESSLNNFKKLNKKAIKIGQEAVVDVNSFTLEGHEHKSLRNGMNSLQKNGYKVSTSMPPQSEDFISELKSVSDEWLTKFDKKELVFSQWTFDSASITNQPIIAVKDVDDKIVSFLNVIPDYASGECTYDLIRRTENSPGGCMDAMIIQLINYAKTYGFKTMNMGLAPLSGMENPDNTAEQIMKFASQKIGSLKHFESLHFFKEKYAEQWENKYLVYENDFDLLQLPVVLSKVMKPDMNKSEE